MLDVLGMLTSRRDGKAAERRGVSFEDRFWGLLKLPDTKSGVSISAESALKVSTVFACIRVIAETMASFPLHFYTRQPGGAKGNADDENIAQVLRRRPNKWQTPFEWIEMSVGHVALRGNCYSRILPGPLGAVDQLIPLHPDRMEVFRRANGERGYKFTDANGMTTNYTQNEIFHVPWFSTDGLKGIDPVQYAREQLGLATAQQTHAASFFKRGTVSNIVLKHPKTLSDQASKRLARNFSQQHSGENAYNPIVLEEGLDVQALGLNFEQSQFLEGRQFQVEDVARVWRMPLHLIGHLERATNNNIEQQSLEFVLYTMLPWVRRFEQAIWRDLIVDQDQMFCEFSVDALLRGDIDSRYKAYATARQWGWLSIDDIRAKENLNPIGEQAGGTVYLSPMNMVPAAFVEPTAEANLKQLTAPPPPAPSPTKAETDQATADAVAAKAEADKAKRLNEQLIAQNITIDREKGTLAAQYDALRARCDEADAKRLDAERLATEALRRSMTVERTQEERDEAERISKEHEQRAAGLAIQLGALQAERDAIREQRDAEAQERRLTEGRWRDERQAREQAERELGFSNPARDETIKASREIVVDAARRMVRWEAEAARRACKKPNFIAAVEEFVAEHEERFCSAVELPMRLHVQLTGRHCDPRQAVQRHLNQSKEQLLEAAGAATPETLAEHVDRTVSAWEGRASALADEWTN